MERIAQSAPYFRGAIQTALGLQGEYPGTVDPGVKPVLLSVDLTDQRYLWLRRGYSWEVGCAEVAPLATVPTALLWGGAVPVANVRRIIHITALRVWSTGGGRLGFGYRVLNQGFVPVLGSTQATILPTVRDSRQGISATSLYRLTVGNSLGAGLGPNDSGWARGSAGGSGVAPLYIYPALTLRYPEAFELRCDTPATAGMGFDIAWEETQASEQELLGDVPI